MYGILKFTRKEPSLFFLGLFSSSWFVKTFSAPRWRSDISVLRKKYKKNNIVYALFSESIFNRLPGGFVGFFLSQCLTLHASSCVNCYRRDKFVI